MPMIDAYIPEGALDPDSERVLMERLTTAVLKWEGADGINEEVRGHIRSIVWLYLHRPLVFVGGKKLRSDVPRYKIVVSLPEGQFDRSSRSGLIEDITQHVLDAEPVGSERDPFRVWVFCHDVPEGTWGSGGKIHGLADISAFVLGDVQAGARHAEVRLKAKRMEREREL